MGLKFKLTIDLNLAGQRFVLGTDYGVCKTDGTQTGDPGSSLLFSGRTVGLNLNLSEILIDLASKVNIDVKSLVPEEYIPQLIVKDVFASYDSKSGAINFIALGLIFGKEVQFIFQYTPAKEGGTSNYAFGIVSDIDDLSGFPMVGKELKDVKFNGLGFIYAKTAEKYKLPELSSPSENNLREMTFPEEGKTYGKGFNFAGDLIYLKGADPISLAIPISSSEPEPEEAAVAAAAPKETSLQPNTKWFKLNKKMGPVNVGQVGFRYKDGMLILLISGDVSIAALKLSLMGLGVGFEFSKLFKKEFEPSFYLDGIGIAYSAPPIEISGTFIRTQEVIGGETIDVYNGGAIIKASKFTISAIGSYAKYKGEPSLFIYGVYDGPIGGPAFFFVTGIAAGFGYNRRVNVPSINEVALFPLVALAMKPQNDGGLDQVLASLSTPMANGKNPIEISIGDYWLAVGIKFTSFKLIESFVLLTVNFGTRLEFAILGLSRLAWPEKSISPKPIVYIELAVLAHFGPGSDVISVEAIVTPNSFVLSKDCKLTGGFAFYTWVSGEHEGDFVITLGGYHPKFIKPAHYPDVPRLGLSWKIGKLLSMKGELYFALTSTAIMAGGKWEVLFKTSIVRASLILWADMLIFWAPFQYTIDVGITVRIEARIKVLFIKIHFNFEMSAQLHIWGPPFAGEIYVDWTIFSFTIPFGDHSKKEPEKLKWDKFCGSFVPQKKVGTGPDPINITISNGLIDVKGKDKFPVINPQQLAITVDSFIPVTQLQYDKKEIADSTKMQTGTGSNTYGNKNSKVGIQPCGFNSDEVSMQMNVEVTLLGTPITMSYVSVAKGVAEALWGPEPSKSSNASPGTSKVMKNVVTGMMLVPPPPPIASQMRTFDFSKLFDRSEKSFDWRFSQVQAGAAYHAYDVLGYFENTRVEGTLEKTYMSVVDKRENIFNLLKNTFDASLPDIEEASINETVIQGGYNYFRAIPVLCGIGKMPQYSTDVK